MSDLSKLQQAVEAAKQAYARASEQHARSRKHAMSLIRIVEEQLREKRIELGQNEVQRERLVQESARLRDMLHGLVMATEAGIFHGFDGGPARSGAEAEAGRGMVPVLLDAAPNDAAAPIGNGGEGSAEYSGEEPNDLRAGLKRVLTKKRGQSARTSEPEQPVPAE